MELHQTIYKRALRTRKRDDKKKLELEHRIEEDTEAVKILKLRLAKGEITKEQYEELRRLIQG